MKPAKHPGFPEYGSGGDHAGARRGRRAFRYGVATAVVFTSLLWFAEQYLRYEETERLYLLALTHEPESARVLLRQAIKIDAATEERPTAKYAAALAEREVDERRLAAYERAYELDPANAFLAVRFGCELFKAGEMRRAHELFRAAYEHDPQNALPLYLEAATLPFIEENNPHLDESFQLIERANASGMPVVFQRPLWFSTLPLRGEWHAELRRGIVREVLAPIETFVTAIGELVEEDLAQDYTGVWYSRLMQIQELGSRIAKDSQPVTGVPQARIGLTMQLRAIQLREHVRSAEGGSAAEFKETEQRIEQALGIVNTFEFEREERVAAQKTTLRVPLQLISQSFALLLAIYLSVYASTRLVQAGRQSWTLRHSPWARIIILSGCAILLLLLIILGHFGAQPVPHAHAVIVFGYVWFVVLGVAAAAGAFYPAFLLPLAQQVLNERNPEASEAARMLMFARRARRVAYVSLMRRYYGILVGCFAIIVCLWTLGFRIFLGLYPWQIRLLAPGLGDHEQEVVRLALAALAGH